MSLEEKNRAAGLTRWHAGETMSTIGAKSLSQIDFACVT
jgi:hypothetical protein